MKCTMLIALLLMANLFFAQTEDEERKEQEREEQEQQSPEEEQAREREREKLQQHREQWTGEDLARYFEKMTDSFRAEYEAIGTPEVYASYVQTIGQIDEVEVLRPYEAFVKRYNDFLNNINRGELHKQYHNDFNIMKRLVEQLSTFTYLRKEMINKGEDLMPGGLDKVYKGDVWYQYFFKYYNGGKFTDVHKLKAYARSKTQIYQKDIDKLMEEMGYENPGAFYNYINSDQYYIKDPNKLLENARMKVDNARMGAGNLFNLNLPQLDVQRSEGASYLDAAEQVLYLQMPEGGYPQRDLDYDIIQWVAGHYLLAQLPRARAKLIDLIHTRGFEDAWAMYATKHGKRFQLYRDPVNKLGEAMNNKYYAVLSRIDVGIHLDGWSEHTALDYYKDELPWLDNGEEMVSEIMQNPAYFSVAPWNSFQIENTRMNAPVSLGRKIKPAEYYEIILGQGILPLDIIFEWLEEEMKE